jgi:hypothetical protein
LRPAARRRLGERAKFRRAARKRRLDADQRFDLIDRTNSVETVPTGALDRALIMEADRK